MQRVRAIRVGVFDGANWTSTSLVDGVEWEPYGDLRFYRVADRTSARWASVDFQQGATAASDKPLHCETRGLLGDALPSDETGRVARIVVRRFAKGEIPKPMTIDGEHVHTAAYGYAGQYMWDERRCLLFDPDPVVTTFKYRRNGWLMDQLVTQYVGSGSLPLSGRRSYNPSRHENVVDYRAATANQGLVLLTRNATTSPFGFEYTDQVKGEVLPDFRTRDADGRTVSRSGAIDSSLMPLWTYDFAPGTTATRGGGGLDSVYRTVTTSSGVYEYFYDGNNRRRLKVHPSGVTDRFFYSADSAQLLVDVGNDDVVSPTQQVTDEYVWLGNRVVAIVRGRLDVKSNRLADFDSTSSCQRNGDFQFGKSCELFYPVTGASNHIDVVLDGKLLVAGVGESDPYGHVNRVQLLAASDHAPYSSPYQRYYGPLVRDFSIARWASFDPTGTGRPPTQVMVKPHFYGVDVEPNAADVYFNDPNKGFPVETVPGDPSSGTSLLASSCGFVSNCGEHLGEVSTFWLYPFGGGYDPFNIDFVAPAVLGGRKYWGVALDRVDYRRYEAGANAWWPAIRLPGQYYDAETDMFENWNRTYDATVGEYLSPEPLLQSPDYVRTMAQSGLSVPAYAYALNSPLRYVDPDGRGALDGIVSGFMWGTGLLWPGAHAGFRQADGYFGPQWVPYVEKHPLMPAGTTTTFGGAICSSDALSSSVWAHESQHIKQAQAISWLPFPLSEAYLPAHLLSQGYSALRGGGYDKFNPLETGPYGRQWTGQGHSGDGTAPTRPWPWW
jgi:RHS repeat-associated protein